MNEKLSELDVSAQAYAGQIAGTDEDSNYTAWFNVYKERFAKLIIEECAKFVEDKFDFCGDELLIAEKIKEQFGMFIEEDVELEDGCVECPCGHDGGTSCGSQYCFLTTPDQKESLDE
jgi:hypothetical protein